eukprot:TRINITY_DN14774_c0_g1_i1.p1 TRINITY_DN14774_c0_g1~~TRINITY_DN14774_c0_g1_i1.p1  ORF type:complete len:746 (+),score=202.70 TRINITY_DN14774_c0_g1_i1:104-2341(+)
MAAERASLQPLHFSEPIYRWENGGGDGDDQAAPPTISFDALHQRIIHGNGDGSGFVAVSVGQEGATSPGGGSAGRLEVNLRAERLRLVRFSPDGALFAYASGTNSVGYGETFRPGSEPVPLSLKVGGGSADCEVLNVFWLPLPSATFQPQEYADLVVVCSQGLEVFRVFPEQRLARSVKVLTTPVRKCWAEPGCGVVLVSTGPRTLQPLDLRQKVPQKMQKFDLVLCRSKAIEEQDVTVMTLYDSTYCIHADPVTGRISLRNISDPAQGTPEHDFVMDLGDGATSAPDAGNSLRLTKVDNLLVVHCVERKVAYVYDVQFRERSLVHCICGPTPAETSAEGPSASTAAGWEFTARGTIIDQASRCVFQLRADMNAVLREFSARYPHDVPSVIQLMLRRTNCRDLIAEIMLQALRSRLSFTELSQVFAVINQAYRRTIERVSSGSGSTGGGATGAPNTVLLSHLEEAIGKQSILSEKDMVCKVFHPRFVQTEGGEAAGLAPEAAADAADAARGAATTAGGPLDLDAWRIPLRAAAAQAEAKAWGSRASRSPPALLSAAIGYLRSLLSMQIIPHQILQCFVFDLCIYYEQEHTLQQLLHYHALLDSPELLRRLKDVAVVRGSTWASQGTLDMALRLQEHGTVAEMLLQTRQYLDVVPFLLNQQVGSFELRRLLEHAAEDAAALREDPDLLSHLVAEIGLWRQEASADPGAFVSPNVVGCERWLGPPAADEGTPAGAAAAAEAMAVAAS